MQPSKCYYECVAKYMTKVYLFGAVVLAALSFFITISWFVPLIDEDFSLTPGSVGFSEIISRCVDQYLQWNARIGDDLSIVISTIPVKIYNVLHGIVIVLFCILLVLFVKIVSNSSLRRISLADTSVFILSTLMLLFMIPAPNEVLFWRTGAANYFYPLVVILLLAIPVSLLVFRNIDIFKLKKNIAWKILITIGLLVLGILAGHSNENVAPVIVLVLLVCILSRWVKVKRIDWWLVMLLFVTAICTYLLLFGPSTQYRIQYYSMINESDVSYISNISANFIDAMSTYIKFALLPILLILSTLPVLKLHKKKVLIVLIASLFFALISVFILMASPYNIPRAFLFASVVSFLPILVWVNCLPKIHSKLILGLCITAAFISSPSIVSEIRGMANFSREKNSQIQSVDHQLKSSNQAYILNLSSHQSRFVYVGVPQQEANRLPEYFNKKEAVVTVKD